MSHPREKEIVAMLRDGISCAKTARDLHVDRLAVYKIRDAHGIPNWYADPNGPACRHGHAWPENLDRDCKGKHFCRLCAQTVARRRYQPVGIDELAVELAVQGQRVRLTPRERREAVRQLMPRNLSGMQIAERIGCTDRTVWRIRKQLKEAA